MLLPCSACSRCREGRYNLCERDMRPGERAGRQLGVNMPADAGGRFSGGYSTHLLVPAEAIVHRIPDAVPWDVAALVEPLAVAFRTLLRGRVAAGDRVTVLGPGPVGLLVTAAARSVGASVTVSGTRRERLELALAMGADRVVDATEALSPDADVSIECAGTPQAQAQAVRAVRRGGRVVLAGACGSGRTLSLDPDDDLLTREIDILPSFLSAHGYEPAIDLLTRDPARLARLVTHRFPLAEAAEAFEAVRDRARGVIKAVLVP
jgi:threonine dehydrogenase-like Zn-dependent dehydrogenase